MKFVTHSYKHADIILQDPKHRASFDEIIEVMSSLTDEELKAKHLSRKNSG